MVPQQGFHLTLCQLLGLVQLPDDMQLQDKLRSVQWPDATVSLTSLVLGPTTRHSASIQTICYAFIMSKISHFLKHIYSDLPA